MCKMIKYPGAFFSIFQKFSGLSGEVKGEKIAENEKNFVCHTLEYFRIPKDSQDCLCHTFQDSYII